MLICDTSAWVELLRDTGSPVCERLDLALDGEAVVCDPIRMEVLAGARSDRHLRDLGNLLAGAVTIPVAPGHYDSAADLYRRCRREGETVRKLLDCLIAAVAIDADLPVLHADRDFEVLARHSPLRLAEV